MLVRISIALILAGGCILFLSACPGPGSEGKILVPLRVCVLKGARLTQQGQSFSDLGNDKIDTLVSQTINDLNTKVWVPGAKIQFYTALYQPLGGSDFNIPVIADPHPQGIVGEIDIGDPGFQFETQEMQDAHQACLNTWSLGENGKKTGTIVIIVRSTVNFGGRISSNAIAPSHSTIAQRNGGADLCVVPRHLTVADVANQYVVISEPQEIKERGGGVFYRILAHELGHTLLLSHGDGLSKGGTSPPQAGPRKFDQDCGGGESTILSLMSPGADVDVITVLQSELARDAAILVPGHNGPL